MRLKGVVVTVLESGAGMWALERHSPGGHAFISAGTEALLGATSSLIWAAGPISTLSARLQTVLDDVVECCD